MDSDVLERIEVGPVEADRKVRGMGFRGDYLEVSLDFLPSWGANAVWSFMFDGWDGLVVSVDAVDRRVWVDDQPFEGGPRKGPRKERMSEVD